MGTYGRDELERAFIHYWRTGAAGEDWDAWADDPAGVGVVTWAPNIPPATPAGLVRTTFGGLALFEPATATVAHAP